MNVGTACQIAITFETGLPLHKRLLTCTGNAVKNARTMEVKVGTPYQEVIDQCGGFAKNHTKSYPAAQ